MNTTRRLGLPASPAPGRLAPRLLAPRLLASRVLPLALLAAAGLAGTADRAAAQLGGPDSATFRRGDELPGMPTPVEYLGDRSATGDFNGDGFDDLVVGVWRADLDGVSDAGVVYVIYGSDDGIRTRGVQRFTQEVAAPFTRIEERAWFGIGLAVGDFDGDLYDDLAIGASGADHLGGPVAGEFGNVTLLLGSRDGLRRPPSPLVARVFRTDDDTLFFGAALAAGDFNGDGLDDLAVGAPGFNGLDGAVFVLFGHPEAVLVELGLQRIDGERRGELGRVLASGDFDGDGFDDLAMSAPRLDAASGEAFRIGGVFLRGGSPRGLVRELPALSQESPGVVGTAETGDEFGSALTVGDFDGDGLDDLAVGAYQEDYGGAGEGEVTVFRGRDAGGVSTSNEQVLRAEDIPALGDPRVEFGRFLEAGDFDGDGFDELVVGIPLDRGGVAERKRALVLVSGGAEGLRPQRAQRVDRDTTGVPGTAVSNDGFGYGLSVGDFNGGGPDLAVGSIFVSAAGQRSAGEMVVIDNVAGGPPDAGIRLNGDRFSVDVLWRDFQGNSGFGQGVTTSDDSAIFYFFEGSNWELMVKVLDGCALNDHYWTFLAATTNVEFTLRVTDTATGTTRFYSNELGQSADAVTDTSSFATCP